MRPRDKNEKIDPEKNAQEYIDALRLIIHYQLQKNAQIRPASPLTRLAHAARPGDFVFYNNLKSEYKSYVDTINDPKKTAVEKLEALKKFASDPKYQDKAIYGGDLHGVISDIDNSISYKGSGVERAWHNIALEIERNAGKYVDAIVRLVDEMRRTASQAPLETYSEYLYIRHPRFGEKSMIATLDEMQKNASDVLKGGQASRDTNEVHAMIAKIDPMQLYEKSSIGNEKLREKAKSAVMRSAQPAKPVKTTSAPVGAVSRGGVFAREKHPVGKAASDPGPSKDNHGPKKKF